MQEDITPITERNLHEHFGDSGYQIKQADEEREDDFPEEDLPEKLDGEKADNREGSWPEAMGPEEENSEVYEGYSFPTNAREDDPSPFAEYLYKFTQRHYPEQLVSLSEVRRVRTQACPLFVRKSQSATSVTAEEPHTETRHIGQLALHGILMKAMRTAAEHVIIQSHRHHPTLTHSITTGPHGVVEMLEPAHSELMAYVESLPSPHLRFHLDTLLDEFLAEYEMANDLARDYIAWYRAAETKEFEVLLAINSPQQKVIIALMPIPSQ